MQNSFVDIFIVYLHKIYTMKNFLFLISVLLVSVSFGQTAEEYFNLGKSKIPFDYEGAIPYLTKAIELDPNYALAYSHRGDAKYALSDIDGACLDWSKAVELGYADAYEYIKKYCK